ncbi:hypothetical protein [Streptomyces californicus]|uniref:hypothetical protein n=1 Tax=Streptomyces californicus TaxID=67351 RepID=UPI0035D5FBD9
MGTELDVTLRGPHAGMDAQHSLSVLNHLLTLLAELESMETQRTRRSATRWTFSGLELGSVRAVLEPLTIAEHSGYDVVDRISLRAVAGLAEAEEEPRIPSGWTPRAAQTARDLARSLGASPDVGMVVCLRVGGETRKSVEVTQRVQQNMREAMRARFTSYGSRRGHVRGLNDSRGIKAVLRTSVGSEIIPLRCPESLRESLRQAWGRDQVEVAGRITENAAGQSVSMDVQEIELLPLESQLTSEDLEGGFWPDMTGGLDSLAYLEALRGEG